MRGWDQLRRLYHPEGRFITAAGGPDPLGPDETIAALRESARDAIFAADVSPVTVSLDRHAAYTTGMVRFRVEDGHAMSSRVWLYTARDGLVYRAIPVGGASEARSRYRDGGLALGL
jgi:hypothetical protein